MELTNDERERAAYVFSLIMKWVGIQAAGLEHPQRFDHTHVTIGENGEITFHSKYTNMGTLTGQERTDALIISSLKWYRLQEGYEGITAGQAGKTLTLSFADPEKIIRAAANLPASIVRPMETSLEVTPEITIPLPPHTRRSEFWPSLPALVTESAQPEGRKLGNLFGLSSRGIKPGDGDLARTGHIRDDV